MLTQGRVVQIGDQGIVHLVHAGLDWFHETASANDSVDFVNIETGCFQFIQDNIFAELELGSHVFEFGDFLGRMLDVLHEFLFLVLVNGNLRGCGSRVNCENFY